MSLTVASNATIDLPQVWKIRFFPLYKSFTLLKNQIREKIIQNADAHGDRLLSWREIFLFKHADEVLF